MQALREQISADATLPALDPDLHFVPYPSVTATKNKKSEVGGQISEVGA